MQRHQLGHSEHHKIHIVGEDLYQLTVEHFNIVKLCKKICESQLIKHDFGSTLGENWHCGAVWKIGWLLRVDVGFYMISIAVSCPL